MSGKRLRRGLFGPQEEGSDRIMEKISLRISVFIIVCVIRMIELGTDGCGLWHLREIFDWESERKDLGRLTCRHENSNKYHLKEVGFGVWFGVL
jgi:hypothetical protein